MKLLDDPYVLAARPDDFPDETVPLPNLKGRAMVAWPATCDQPRMERALREHGAQPRIVFRSASNEALLSMVRHGLGCAILPKLAVTGVDGDRRLRIHSLEPAPSREVYLHWPKGRSSVTARDPGDRARPRDRGRRPGLTRSGDVELDPQQDVPRLRESTDVVALRDLDRHLSPG